MRPIKTTQFFRPTSSEVNSFKQIVSAISLEFPLARSDLRNDLLCRRTEVWVLPMGSALIEELRTWNQKNNQHEG